MQQQQKHPSYHSPRRNLSLGEWVILLLNLLMSGFCGWMLRFSLLIPDYASATPISVVTTCIGLTSICLLIRRPRLAAHFSWLSVLGIGLLACVFWFFPGEDDSLTDRFLTFGFLLFLFLLVCASGWFLRKIETEK